MRILYLHQYFNTPKMSGGTRSYEMARRLVKAGHKVHMVTTNRQNHNKKYKWYKTVEAGIIVHWLPISYSNTMSYPKRMKAFFHFAFKSALYSASIPADIIFATSTPLTIAIPAVYAALCQKISIVFEVRDLWPQIPIAVGALKSPLIPAAFLLERFAYLNSAQIIALSPGMKAGVVSTGYPKGRVHVVPNSCDINFFQVPTKTGVSFRKRFTWLDDHPLVIYAGTFGLINGVEYFAKLAGEILKISQDVRFLAIGHGTEYEKVRRIAVELGVLNNNFFLKSKLPKEEMPALLSAATIAVSLVIDLPQLWSNSANKFFDTLAAGKPVAINYRGWQAELLAESGAGIVLPANDIPRAAQMLSNALSDDKWLKNAGNASLTLARTHFSRDKMAVKLENILQNVVNS
jgi:glycosyltransferase involved in cell wall biosynthesis